MLSPVGKVMVACALRSSSPDLISRVASQGPAGSDLSSGIVTGSLCLGASVVPSCAGNGPADKPPGPCVSLRFPLRSMARLPVLVTCASTYGDPSLFLAAVSESIRKSEGGRPPVPTSR